MRSAAGLPVVATRVEGTSELIAEGRKGLLGSPKSPQELAAAIETILSDPAQTRTMYQLGRERATSEFSWDRMIDRYSNLYSSLPESQGGGQ